MPQQPPTSQSTPSSDDRGLLEELVSLQKQQNQDLADIRKNIGCFYQYMIFSIVAGVIFGIIYLLNSCSSF